MNPVPTPSAPSFAFSIDACIGPFAAHAAGPPAGPQAWLNQRLCIAPVQRTTADVQLQVFPVG